MKREIWTEVIRYLRKVDMDGRILLKRLLEKQGVKERTEFNASG